METKANNTLVGLVVLILIAGLISAGLWLSVGFDQKNYDYYLVYMHEAVSGLSEEAPVKYNGVKVGVVKKIRLNREDPQLVEILLAIEEGTPITVSTYATLMSQGITGTAYLGLGATSGDLAPLKASPGDIYPVIPAKPSLFNQLDKVLTDVSENINKVSLEIQRVFDAENAQYFKDTLKNLDKFSSTIANNSEQISQSIKHADEMLDNMSRISKDLPSIVTEFKTTVGQFNAMAKEMTRAGQSVSDTMVSGKSAINKITQQTLPPAVVLLRRLDHIAADLEQVSTQIKQNPSVIIRGTPAPKPGPGE